MSHLLPFGKGISWAYNPFNDHLARVLFHSICMTFLWQSLSSEAVLQKKLIQEHFMGASLTVYGHKSLPDEYIFNISSVFHRIQEENFLALNFLTTKVENSM